MTKNPVLRLALVIPLCGMVVAGLLATAWLALGSPKPAEGSVWFQVIGTGSAEFTGAPDAPFFFLVLGTDARSDADRGLGDAIHVIGVNPVTKQATILNVPRDTQAPGGDKINAAHALSGLPGMVEQLNQMMGIQIQYAVSTNFPGLIGMVNDIGGIWITLPPVTEGDGTWDDTDSGAVFQPGPQHMIGHQILALSRDRKDFEITGDVTRSFNQGLVIIAALDTLRKQNPGDAGTIKLAAILANHVQTHNVSLIDLFRLGRLALSIDPANVRNVTIPVGGGSGSNLSVGGDAGSLFQDFADDAVLQTH